MYGENSAYEKLESGGSVLYDVHIKMGNDSVESYFAMRKIEVKNDKNGIPRIIFEQQTIFSKKEFWIRDTGRTVCIHHRVMKR